MNYDCTQMTVDDVAKWLLKLGYGNSVVDKFTENAINGEVLADNLSGDDLKEELGITQLGYRKKLLKDIGELASGKHRLELPCGVPTFRFYIDIANCPFPSANLDKFIERLKAKVAEKVGYDDWQQAPHEGYYFVQKTDEKESFHKAMRAMNFRSVYVGSKSGSDDHALRDIISTLIRATDINRSRTIVVLVTGDSDIHQSIRDCAEKFPFVVLVHNRQAIEGLISILPPSRRINIDTEIRTPDDAPPSPVAVRSVTAPPVAPVEVVPKSTVNLEVVRDPPAIQKCVVSPAMTNDVVPERPATVEAVPVKPVIPATPLDTELASKSVMLPVTADSDFHSNGTTSTLITDPLANIHIPPPIARPVSLDSLTASHPPAHANVSAPNVILDILESKPFVNFSGATKPASSETSQTSNAHSTEVTPAVTPTKETKATKKEVSKETKETKEPKETKETKVKPNGSTASKKVVMATSADIVRAGSPGSKQITTQVLTAPLPAEKKKQTQGHGYGYGFAHNRKTEICRHWKNGNKCDKSKELCDYAHGEDDLQQRKNELCKDHFNNKTGCPKANCPFAHSEDELPEDVRAHLRTHMCKLGAECKKGKACHFAHSRDELPERIRETYKTKLCRDFHEKKCTFGDQCRDAHGEPDQTGERVPQNKRYPYPCKHYEEGFCFNGKLCNFLHVRKKKGAAEVSKK
eukprot:TRINITY_DN4075_c0_g2_i1.p1 TRINITY_DN4075_c0_g2~~TRINITY_DN4075_c0_g2_i1.p1  ORF type:complete len:693 (+),score=146.32 TRINITY_DN4075_c0_g2_i1:77-2155(+)